MSSFVQGTKHLAAWDCVQGGEDVRLLLFIFYLECFVHLWLVLLVSLFVALIYNVLVWYCGALWKIAIWPDLLSFLVNGTIS